MTSKTIDRLHTVKAKTKLSRSTIYGEMAKGKFPASVQLTARAVGWDSSAVDAWIEERIHAASQKKAAAKGGRQ